MSDARSAREVESERVETNERTGYTDGTLKNGIGDNRYNMITGLPAPEKWWGPHRP